MNKWQMEGRTLQAWGPGGFTYDDRERRHDSIHPAPETRLRRRLKNRKRRFSELAAA